MGKLDRTICDRVLCRVHSSLCRPFFGPMITCEEWTADNLDCGVYCARDEHVGMGTLSSNMGRTTTFKQAGMSW